MFEKIEHNGALLAVVIRTSFTSGGIQFFTPNELSQQLAYMHHPPGKKIDAHIHTPASREVLLTQETLFIKRGRLRVDFFDDNQCYLESRVLEAGDVILLVQGGHGFEVLEELEMFEVKQGPYLGADDKTRFTGKLPATLNFGTPPSAGE
jgi:mannose-6-phosphate isomerase-like protein (cupin superfamily)